MSIPVNLHKISLFKCVNTGNDLTPHFLPKSMGMYGEEGGEAPDDECISFWDANWILVHELIEFTSD